MTSRDSSDRPSQEQVSEFAGELRTVVETLAVCEFTSAQLSEATGHVRSLRASLKGPPRARWYDDDAMTIDRASKRAYLDQSPIRGRLNPIAPPLRTEVVERPDGRRVVRGRARLGMAYEGPPHGVHGGWVAAIFDDLLGQAQGFTSESAVTATLKVRFRHVTPVDEDLLFEGWVHEDKGRRIVARATCHAGDTLTADAEGLFVRVDFNEIQTLMRERREGSAS